MRNGEMLNCDDLRDAVTVVQTTSSKPSSAQNINLKTPSHGLTTNHKESNSAPVAKTVFQCRACQKEFVTEKYLCMHMALHRTTQANSVVTSSSSSTALNGAKLDNSKGGTTTTTQISSDDSIKLVRSDGTGGSHWTCKLCGKTFAQSSNYKNHIRTHSDERPFVCDICCIGFKERYHLKKHILFKHSDELKEECRVCGKRFKDSTAVRAHERIHSEERPYGCQRCDKTFKTSECLWHHENRSRTCGKSLNGKGAMDSNGGGAIVNPPGPRFRRGRLPSKRLALGKVTKTVAEAEDDAGIKIDHVEEISASVKIELEREIPDYYFKPLPPGLCPSYEFENMMDVLHPEASLTIGRDLAFPKTKQQSVKSADVGHETASEFGGAEVNNACRSLGGIVTANVKLLDQFAAPYWANEWTSSSASSLSSVGTGVLLESLPSRPATGVASYDMIGDVYHRCTETHQNSWRQDAPSYHALYAGKNAKSDTVANNLSQYASHDSVCQIHLSSAAATEAVSSAAAAAAAATTTLPFADLVKLGHHHATTMTTAATKSDDPQGSSVSTQQVVQQQVQRTPCCSYASDYRPNDKKAIRSIMTSLTSAPEVPWPGTRSMEPTTASAARVLDGHQEYSTTSSAPCTGSLYHVSIASVPTAVVAPFKRENTIRPLDVGVSSAEMEQPPCNSLPPFETFAPITLRGVQKPQRVAMPAASAVCTSAAAAAARPLSTYAAGLYRFDGSAADQCPTIQKYLLGGGGGHPKASVSINHGPSCGAQGQRESLSNSHCYGKLSPRTGSGRRHPDLFSSSLAPLEAEHSFMAPGRHQTPEFCRFVPDTQMKMGGGGGGAQRELVVLPTRPSDVGFFQMTPGPDSQSAIFQSLNDIADSAAAAMSVNLYQQI